MWGGRGLKGSGAIANDSSLRLVHRCETELLRRAYRARGRMTIVHSFIHFFHQLFIEHLLYAKCAFSPWGDSPHGSLIQSGRDSAKLAFSTLALRHLRTDGGLKTDSLSFLSPWQPRGF